MSERGQNPGVLCVGRLYCDLVFSGVPRTPSMGTEIFAEGLGLYAGGGAFITAAYLRALGRPAYLAATLSGPPFDRIIADQIDAQDIDRSLCQPAPVGTDPQVTVVMVGQDDRAFLTKTSGAAIVVPPASALRARGISHMHISELRTLVEHPDLLDLARAADLTVSLDCGWQDDIAGGAEALIAQVDVFLPNEMEAAHLVAHGVPEGCAPLTIIKQGLQGARAVSATDALSCATRTVQIVDTTGAGDAFNAGFLDTWIDQLPLEHCLGNGNACGGAAIQGVGGCGGVDIVAAARAGATHQVVAE